MVSYLCNGLRLGFDTMTSNTPVTAKECDNLQSAKQNPEAVDRLIKSECDKGFLLGPFKTSPFVI